MFILHTARKHSQSRLLDCFKFQCWWHDVWTLTCIIFFMNLKVEKFPEQSFMQDTWLSKLIVFFATVKGNFSVHFELILMYLCYFSKSYRVLNVQQQKVKMFFLFPDKLIYLDSKLHISYLQIFLYKIPPKDWYRMANVICFYPHMCISFLFSYFLLLRTSQVLLLLNASFI